MLLPELSPFPGSLFCLSWSLIASVLLIHDAWWFTHIYSWGSWKLLRISKCRAVQSQSECQSMRGPAVCSWCPHGTAPALPSSFRFFEEPWFFVFIWKVNPEAFIYLGKEHIDHCQFVLLCPAPHVILMSSVEPEISEDGASSRFCRVHDSLLPSVHCLPWGRLYRA